MPARVIVAATSAVMAMVMEATGDIMAVVGIMAMAAMAGAGPGMDGVSALGSGLALAGLITTAATLIIPRTMRRRVITMTRIMMSRMIRMEMDPCNNNSNNSGRSSGSRR